MEEPSMIHEALQRTMDTILLSRIPQLPKTKDHSSLLLSAPTVNSVREELRKTKGGNTIYRIDIIFSNIINNEKPVLLERWEINHKKEQTKDKRIEDFNTQLRRSFKRITVMLRTLHSFCRIVPAYQIFNRARSMHDQSKIKLDFVISVQNSSRQWDMILGSDSRLGNLEFDEIQQSNQRQIKSFALPEILTPHGELNVCVHYQSEVTSIEATSIEVEESSKPKSGLGALLSQQQEMGMPQDRHGSNDRIPFPKAFSSPQQTSTIPFPPPPSSMSSNKPPISSSMGASRPMSIPSSSNNRGGRPRARSDHIYSKSEGYRDGPLQHSFQWPNQREDPRREENSFSGAPFLLVDSSSLNSDSSLTPVRCSPPLGFMSQPHSLLSSSPQTMLDQRPYSAASMINTSKNNKNHHSIEDDDEEEAFHSLPESPFTRSQLVDPYSPWNNGPDSLPNEIPSIFSSMHGLSLATGPSSFGTNGASAGGGGSSSGGGGGGGVGYLASQPSPSEVQQESDASFLDLPFACNLDMEEDNTVSSFSDHLENDKSSSTSSKSLQVSSFVHLIDSAPQLSFASPQTNTTNSRQGSGEGGGDGNDTTMSSIDDELRECQLFGQALKS